MPEEGVVGGVPGDSRGLSGEGAAQRHARAAQGLRVEVGCAAREVGDEDLPGALDHRRGEGAAAVVGPGVQEPSEPDDHIAGPLGQLGAPGGEDADPVAVCPRRDIGIGEGEGARRGVRQRLAIPGDRHARVGGEGGEAPGEDDVIVRLREADEVGDRADGEGGGRDLHDAHQVRVRDELRVVRRVVGEAGDPAGEVVRGVEVVGDSERGARRGVRIEPLDALGAEVAREADRDMEVEVLRRDEVVGRDHGQAEPVGGTAEGGGPRAREGRGRIEGPVRREAEQLVVEDVEGPEAVRVGRVGETGEEAAGGGRGEGGQGVDHPVEVALHQRGAEVPLHEPVELAVRGVVGETRVGGGTDGARLRHQGPRRRDVGRVEGVVEPGEQVGDIEGRPGHGHRVGVLSRVVTQGERA